MEEVIGVSDRVAVMHEGRISGVLEREQFSEYNVLRLAIGQALEPAGAAAMMKKELGLFLLLVVVVGDHRALINPASCPA